jgi:hypothetical protein
MMRASGQKTDDLQPLRRGQGRQEFRTPFGMEGIAIRHRWPPQSDAGRGDIRRA